MFVAAGVGAEPIWKDLNRQVFLGDDAFVARMQKRNAKAAEDINIPKMQRRKPAAKLPVIAARHRNKEAAMAAAHAIGQYSYQHRRSFRRTVDYRVKTPVTAEALIELLRGHAEADKALKLMQLPDPLQIAWEYEAERGGQWRLSLHATESDSQQGFRLQAQVIRLR